MSGETSWGGPFGQPIIVFNEAARDALPAEPRGVCITLGRVTPGDGGGGMHLYSSGAWLTLPDSGSNASGEYVKYANGVMVCWTSITLVYLSVHWLTGTWTYPAAFASGVVPAVTALPLGGSGFPTVGRPAVYNAAPSNTSVTIGEYDNASSYTGSDSLTVYVTAIGRWKA